MQLLLWVAGRGRQGNSLVKEMRIRKQKENCVEIKEAGEKESREEERERKREERGRSMYRRGGKRVGVCGRQLEQFAR